MKINIEIDFSMNLLGSIMLTPNKIVAAIIAINESELNNSVIIFF